MSRFFRKTPNSDYEPTKLISTRFTEHPQWERASLQIICDIDKTWLDTRFESFFGLAKIAFEKAQDKITVEGASELLSALRWSKHPSLGKRPHPLHFVSSSPPQLRAVLEEKMAIDCLDWTSDTFKDQGYNVKQGRWDLLTQQIPYKSIAIFKLLAQMDDSSQLIFLGDNAEADPFIYLGIYFFLHGKLNSDGLLKYLQIADVSEETTEKIRPFLNFPQRPKVALIGIRNLDSSPQVLSAPLTDPLFWFKDYFELSVQATNQDLITPQQLQQLTLKFHNHYGFPISKLLQACSTFGGTLQENPEYLKLADKLKELSSSPLLETPALSTSKESQDFHDLKQDDILALTQQWHEKRMNTSNDS